MVRGVDALGSHPFTLVVASLTHLLHMFAKLGVDDHTTAVTAAMEREMLRLNK